MLVVLSKENKSKKFAKKNREQERNMLIIQYVYCAEVILSFFQSVPNKSPLNEITSLQDSAAPRRGNGRYSH